MAYMPAAAAAVIRADLAAAFPKGEGWKFSVRKDQGSVTVSILAAPVRFEAWDVDAYAGPDSAKPRTTSEAMERDARVAMTNSDVNRFWFKEHHPPTSAAVFEKVLDIILKEHWDHSDSQIDYFNCAFYAYLGVGVWGKPCVYTGKP